jgi:hypothetical protein
VRLKFWRYPAAEIPSTDRAELIAWLYGRWQILDDWIDEVHAGGTVAQGVKAHA